MDVTASVGSVGVIWVGRDATVTPHEVLTLSLTNLLTYYAPNRVLFVLIHNIILIRIIHNTARFTLYCRTLVVGVCAWQKEIVADGYVN